jgi:hypothetical protein
MTAPASPPPEPRSLTLTRKSILLLLIALVVTLGLVVLLHHVWIYTFPLLMSAFFSDAFLGLAAGLAVRQVLPRQPLYMRIIALVVFVFVTLELLGWFTGGQFGLGSVEIGRNGVDWLSLGQLALSVGIAFLSLYAWGKPRPEKEPADPPARKRKARARKRPAKKSPSTSAATGASPAAAQTTDPPAKSLSLSKPGPHVRPKRKHATSRKPELHLSAEEEHRCPYCLELILPDDPRGTVECKICHTLHHADCWAITGACQVPHYTS